MKYIKKYLTFQVVLLILGFYFIITLLKKPKLNSPLSDDKTVNDAISVLDEAFHHLGTFDDDINPIWDVLIKLNKTQIIKLHEDFGYRYYNPISRVYGFSIPFLSNMYPKKDLNSIFKAELDNSQIIRLTDIYNQKGLDFPFIH